MLHKETDTRQEQVMEVARAMMTAARTAPKARGIDDVGIITVTGDHLQELAAETRNIGETRGQEFFLRDAINIENSQAVVLIGTKDKVRSLDCGLCGFPICAEKVRLSPRTLCSFVMNDVGIALSSAVSAASAYHIDNRIMYSAGVAAEALDYMPGHRAIFAIPLSVSGKNIFFDRKYP